MNGVSIALQENVTQNQVVLFTFFPIPALPHNGNIDKHIMRW